MTQKANFIFIVLLLASLSSDAQTLTYRHFVEQGDSLYSAKQYAGAAKAYSQAFRVNNWKGQNSDRYNAACSWALSGNIDSAFSNLQRITDSAQFASYNMTTKDSDLISLHDDSRWQPLITKIAANKALLESKRNKPLMAMLDSVFKEDQQIRIAHKDTAEKYGYQSQQAMILIEKIKKNDSVNIAKVKAVIEKYGWLGSDVVGDNGNSALFLVIQHADNETQRHYLPTLRDAVKNGKADPSQLALLEDRVAVNYGKKQIYGSQIGRDPDNNTYFVMPVEDPDKLDERRVAIGLETMAKYGKRFNIHWDLEQYKKDLPRIEVLVKKMGF